MQEVHSSFKKLCSLESQKDAKKTDIQQNLKKISDEYRKLLKELGTKAKVEVEPDLLTFLLDGVIKHTSEVVYSVCPGARGYDAACLLSTQDLEEKELEGILQELTKEIKEKGRF